MHRFHRLGANSESREGEETHWSEGDRQTKEGKELGARVGAAEMRRAARAGGLRDRGGWRLGHASHATSDDGW